MPPVTPSAMSAMATPNFQLPISKSRLGAGRWRLDVSLFYLDDLAAQNFLLCDGNLLLALFARHGTGQQLARTFAREDDEFEPVFLGCSLHDVLSSGPEVSLYVPVTSTFHVSTSQHGLQAGLP